MYVTILVVIAYSIAIVIGGHGAAPMPVIIFIGLQNLLALEAGHKIWSIAALLGSVSFMYLAVITLKFKPSATKYVNHRALSVIGLYMSWLLPALAIAADEAAFNDSNFLYNMLAEMAFSAPFQIATAVALYVFFKRLHEQVKQ